MWPSCWSLLGSVAAGLAKKRLAVGMPPIQVVMVDDAETAVSILEELHSAKMT